MYTLLNVIRPFSFYNPSTQINYVTCKVEFTKNDFRFSFVRNVYTKDTKIQFEVTYNRQSWYFYYHIYNDERKPEFNVNTH